MTATVLRLCTPGRVEGLEALEKAGDRGLVSTRFLSFSGLGTLGWAERDETPDALGEHRWRLTQTGRSALRIWRDRPAAWRADRAAR